MYPLVAKEMFASLTSMIYKRAPHVTIKEDNYMKQKQINLYCDSGVLEFGVSKKYITQEALFPISSFQGFVCVHETKSVLVLYVAPTCAARKVICAVPTSYEVLDKILNYWREYMENRNDWTKDHDLTVYRDELDVELAEERAKFLTEEDNDFDEPYYYE